MSAAKRKSVTKRASAPRAKRAGGVKGKRRASSSKGISSGVAPALLDDLVERAKVVRENAHAPYSKYKVGAAILTKRGNVYVGCNVENASFGATICAERGAIMQMIAAGDRHPIACAVVTEDGGSPCGVCRQVLAEFTRDMPIALIGLHRPDGEGGPVVQLADLLPLAFELRR